MKDITCFSANVLAQFDNKYDNILVQFSFCDLFLK